MSVDLSQFHEVFFEECFECLDLMETELSSLDLEDVDLEKVSTICRCAHTIKGSGAMFGFDTASDYAQTLEKHLKGMKAGDIKITQETKDILFSAIDFLRSVITQLQNQQTVDQANLQKHRDSIESELSRLAST